VQILRIIMNAYESRENTAHAQLVRSHLNGIEKGFGDPLDCDHCRSAPIERSAAGQRSIFDRINAIIEEQNYCQNISAQTCVPWRSRFFGLIASDVNKLYVPEPVECFQERECSTMISMLCSVTNY
jgi:hypothetical protein